jgi:PTS system mannose-specific IIA component
MAEAGSTEVGVVVVGHGQTASALVRAAEGIVGRPLAGVVAVDAGAGEDATLRERLGAAVLAADHGAGVLLLADMFGASPCACGMRMAAGQPLAVLAGLNLAMLIKLSTLDRSALGPVEIAEACRDSAQRAMTVSSTVSAPPADPLASRKEPA